VAVGLSQVSSLLFVDDVIDVSTNCLDAEDSHDNAVLFSKKKKLPFSKKKCKSMVVNKKKNDPTPNLYIEEAKVDNVCNIVYLGDVFNNKGNNTDLIDDRIRRGTSALIQIEALIKETCLGIFTISVCLLLYRSLFLSCITFNSESWSKLLERDIHPIHCLQMKFLKKMVIAPKSVSNAFTCLEFGVLPIVYEVHKRKLNFLHHIIQMREDDPVKMMWENMRKFVDEKNWWTDVSAMLDKYGLKLESVSRSSRHVWNMKVAEAVEKVAFQQLVDECKSKSKTSSLNYEKFETQKYLLCLYPKQSNIIFQCRSKTLDIKQFREYKYQDSVCRRCGQEEEVLLHVVNCGHAEHLDVSVIDKLDVVDDSVKLQLIRVTMRIESCMDAVEAKEEMKN